MSDKKLVSLIIPAFNEASNIEPISNELIELFSKQEYDLEIIFIDDGSNDATYDEIEKLSKKHSFIKGIKLSNNFGQQVALACGLDHVSGNATIMMDADLQHDTKTIKDMLELWESGYLVVNTKKKNTYENGLAKGFFSHSFYAFFNYVSKIQIPHSGTDFRLLDSKCVFALKELREKHRFYRGLVPLVGFKSVTIDTEIRERHSGNPSFSFKKSLNLGLNGLLSFSSFALLAPFFLGIALMAVIGIYYLSGFVLYLMGLTTIEPGWLSISTLIIIIFSVQLIFMGIFGIYIAKIFEECKNRPLYFIEKKTNLSEGI